MSNDMYLISLYYMFKSKAANYYNEALIHQDDLEHSLEALFLWREHVDLQTQMWKKMNKNNRIKAVMISTGFSA